MSESELLREGLYLMVFGMGFVFSFLVVLVYAVKLMSYLVVRFSPEPETTVKPMVRHEVSSQPAEASSQLADNERIKAVLAAAIHHHRRVRSLN